MSCPIAMEPNTSREESKMSRNLRAMRVVTVLLAFFAACGARAAEGYTNWDTFDGASEISEQRWLGLERHRMIEGGALRMIQRDRGSQTGNTGMFSNWWDTSLANAGAVTQMKATISVNALEVSHCAANAAQGKVTARINGAFFNAGPGVPSPGNRINDVGAVIEVLRDANSVDPPNVMRLRGSVYQCTQPDCSFGWIGLGGVDLGTATVGESVTVKLEWDKPSKRFNFFRGSDPVQRVSYVVSDALAPALVYRLVGTSTMLAHCTAGRTEGFIDAKFDSIFVNASAAPPP